MTFHSSELQMNAPVALAEVLELYAQKASKWKLFAGGTDLMVELHAGHCHQHQFLSLHRVRELRGIHVDEQFVTIGATSTYRDIVNNEVIANEFPNLHQAARWTGAVAIQSRGTLGGNIGNASPAADSPPALISYNSEIELASVRGRRWVRYSDFHTGYKTTCAASDEIITRVRIPRRKEKFVHFYKKVGPRKALAISKLSLAAAVRLENKVVCEVSLGFASLAPTVLKPVSIENDLLGVHLSVDSIKQLREKFQQTLRPITDVRSTAEYRATVAANLFEEFLKSLLSCCE